MFWQLIFRYLNLSDFSCCKPRHLYITNMHLKTEAETETETRSTGLLTKTASFNIIILRNRKRNRISEIMQPVIPSNQVDILH